MVKLIIITITLVLSGLMLQLSRFFDNKNRNLNGRNPEEPMIDLDGEKVYFLNKNDRISLLFVALVCIGIGAVFLELIFL